MRAKNLFFLMVAWGLISLEFRVGAATVTINGAQTNQVIDGFGANINARSWTNNEMVPVLDALIDGAGFTVFRVVFDDTDWEGTNDNADASVMNWSYYNSVYSTPRFERLWGMIGYLNQRGFTNGVMLNFQGPGPQWMGGATLPPGYEEEWAEMIASLLIYARNTRHLQFGLVAPDNEPDNVNQGVDVVNAAQYVTMLHLLAQKLDTNGLSDLRFVGPDRAGGGTNFMPEMMSDPVVMGKLAHFGVHSYSGSGTGSTGVRNFINQSGFQDRTMWMTEFNVWCDSCELSINTNDWTYFRGTAEYLLGHLATGASAGMVWEGSDSFWLMRNPRWTLWGLLGVDDTNAVTKTYTARKNFYTLAQIARFVRPGAQQIGLGGSLGSLMLQAYYHKVSGQLTIVGVNPDDATTLSGTLTSLPTLASLEFYYTSSSTNFYHSATVPVTNGAFAVSIPADCVFTVTGFDPVKTVVSVAITNPVEGAQFIAPATIPISASATTSGGSLGTVAFFNGATKLGQAAIAPYSIVWSNVVPGDYVLTASATNSLGNSKVSAPVHVVVVAPVLRSSVETNGIAIGWAGTATNYVLEAATNLKPPINWSPLTNAQEQVGDQQRVILKPVAGQQFFRLRWP